ncbi:Hypothetical predicted protein [Mytilus galloprovincialis]|uniref:SEA domain-containing protein n=1 Tax=Mytilus galloprovincialis TaxID=29158 RepID=A0A8B6DU08_MYTGA|nr:Hypothetical predicted protein [Mytilus galloprovincialis]
MTPDAAGDVASTIPPRKGSLIAETDVSLKPFANKSVTPANITQQIIDKTRLLFTRNEWFEGLPPMTKGSNKTTLADIENGMKQVENNSAVLQCKSSSLKIDKSGSCVEICTPYVCGRGICYLDKTYQPRCSCNQIGDETYVYSGANCEVITLAAKYIIAAVCGSGVIVIILAILILLVFKGKRRKKNDEKDHYVTEHDTLSYNHPAALFGRQRTPSNLYLSMRHMSYAGDDRKYSILDDDTTNRGSTYIYNPSAELAKRQEIDPRYEDEYYNKSFCSEEFAIRRPHLRNGGDLIYYKDNRPKTLRPDYM